MKVFENTIIYAGKWLNMHKTLFPLKNGGTGIWEHVSRPNRKTDSDGVSILATIYQEKVLKLVIISVYRIPLNQFVLELPAGMIDINDVDPVSAALRELKEETGYTALRSHVKEQGIIAYNDPWKSNECSRLIRVHIDENLPENKIPLQRLDQEEDIRVELIPLKGFKKELIQLAEKKSYAIDSRIYLFALGLELNQ